MSSTLEYQTPVAGARGSIVTQTIALFVDAYRELNAKKLFWITLLLSLAVVVAFAFISITPKGLKVFAWEIPGFFNTTIIPADTFYKFLFTEFAISWWLGVASLVLALISVASIIPDFIAGGSIDLYLARPISRLRLFITKYVTSLLFVALQVLVFSAACFVIIGIKGGTWEFGIFLAVPLVTLLFSYIYCICVLVGLLTRSALAAILLSLLFWLGLFALNSADGALLTFRTMTHERQLRFANNLAAWDAMIEQHKSLPPEKQSPGALKNFEYQRDGLLPGKREVDDTAGKIDFWYRLIHRVRAPFPKTDETAGLMSRWLVEPDPILNAQRQSSERDRERRDARRAAMNRAKEVSTTTRAAAITPPPLQHTDLSPHDPDVIDELQTQLDARSAAGIIGSSLAFEIVVLAIAAWIFCRRDF